MEERNNNNVVTAVIITVLVMVVLGLVGFVVYDTTIGKANESNTGENNTVDNNEKKEPECCSCCGPEVEVCISLCCPCS